jgi:hypothetical protein
MQQNFSAKTKLNIIKKVIISALYHKIPNEAESVLQVTKYKMNMRTVHANMMCVSYVAKVN